MRKDTFEKIKYFIEIESKSNNILLTEFSNELSYQDKLMIKCSCGEIYNTLFTHFKNDMKRQCSFCGYFQISTTDTNREKLLYLFKNMYQKSGIYYIKNVVNNKMYIGQSSNMWTRFRDGHLTKLRLSKHPNYHLQKSWNKYGEENFEFGILEYCDNENLTFNEQKWMDFYNSYNKENGYNIVDTAHEYYNYEIPEETRKKQSERMSGSRNPMYGKTHTDEIKQLLSDRCSIPVFQFDKTGKFIKKYKSGVEAEKETGIWATNIRESSKNKKGHNKAGGYIWISEEDFYSDDLEDILVKRVNARGCGEYERNKHAST